MAPRLVGFITAPVALLAVLLLVVAIGSAWYVRSLQRSVSDLMAINVESVRAAQELEISIREVRTQFDRYLITQDEGHLSPIPRLRQRTADALSAAERVATTSEEQGLMKRTRTGYEHFFGEYERILREREQWKYPKIIELSDAVLLREILEPAHEYLRLNEGMLARSSEANQQLTDRITFGLIALGLCGAVGGLLGGTIISVAVRRSMLRAEEGFRSASEQLGQAVPRSSSSLDRGPTPIDPIERMKLSASAVISRLRQTERDALRAEQLAWVGQMAAGLAHEVRNPLMAIKLLVQATVERRGGGVFRPRDLQVLEEEIVRLEHIVSGFLDFARPPRPDPRPVDVAELARRTIDAVAARAEMQAVRMRVEAAVGPTVVSADPNQLRQILFNLLFNALDAQPQGGHVTVRVGLDPTRAGRSDLILTVEDGGPGLPPELGERVFEPFVSTKESGLGLGLSICRRIAESHGGGLSVVSTDRGATFTLYLPVTPPTDPTPALSA
ncbi:MAG: ATP-binding protein [Fimbriiglobus sp.]|jgi:signal transduction histidine kinase|nr:ATP-binding protein [Fimbriiglobus sp.]